MSWFSLGLRGKEALHTHSTVSNFCTGGFASTLVFKKVVQPSSLYGKVREATITRISHLMMPKLEPVSLKVSERLLRLSLTKGKWNHLIGKYKDTFILNPKEHLHFMGKIGTHFLRKTAKVFVAKITRQTNSSSPSISQDSSQIKIAVMPMKHKIAFLPGRYTIEEAKIIKDFAKKGHFSEAIHQAAFFSLKPTFDKAIYAAMNAMVKNASGKTCDLAVKKLLNVTIFPIFYTGVLAVIKFAADHWGEETHSQLADIADRAPRPSTILALSAVGNAAQMAHEIWKATKQAAKADQHDCDKEEVQKIVLKLILNSARRKLENNQFLTEIGANSDPQKIDAMIETFVVEAVDLYWNDLHNKKILGLPLVA